MKRTNYNDTIRLLPAHPINDQPLNHLPLSSNHYGGVTDDINFNKHKQKQKYKHENKNKQNNDNNYLDKQLNSSSNLSNFKDIDNDDQTSEEDYDILEELYYHDPSKITNTNTSKNSLLLSSNVNTTPIYYDPKYETPSQNEYQLQTSIPITDITNQQLFQRGYISDLKSIPSSSRSCSYTSLDTSFLNKHNYINNNDIINLKRKDKRNPSYACSTYASSSYSFSNSIDNFNSFKETTENNKSNCYLNYRSGIIDKSFDDLFYGTLNIINEVNVSDDNKQETDTNSAPINSTSIINNCNKDEKLKEKLRKKMLETQMIKDDRTPLGSSDITSPLHPKKSKSQLEYDLKIDHKSLFSNNNGNEKYKSKDTDDHLTFKKVAKKKKSFGESLWNLVTFSRSSAIDDRTPTDDNISIDDSIYDTVMGSVIVRSDKKLPNEDKGNVLSRIVSMKTIDDLFQDNDNDQEMSSGSTCVSDEEEDRLKSKENEKDIGNDTTYDFDDGYDCNYTDYDYYCKHGNGSTNKNSTRTSISSKATLTSRFLGANRDFSYEYGNYLREKEEEKAEQGEEPGSEPGAEQKREEKQGTLARIRRQTSRISLKLLGLSRNEKKQRKFEGFKRRVKGFFGVCV